MKSKTNPNSQTNPNPDSSFWILRIWNLFFIWFVSDFDIRISDLFRRVLGARNSHEVVVFKIHDASV